MQRYALELSGHFGDRIRHLEPGQWAKGAKGHLWEQVYLPLALRGSLLWSPASTGPVSVSRQVSTIHDLSAIEHPEWYDRKFAEWYGWVIPRLARVCRHIIAVSSFTRDRLIERYRIPANKLSVVLNGVGEAFHPCSQDQIERARQVVGIPAKPYVLYVGSVEPRKNLNRLLDAWTGIQNRIPEDVHLVVSGVRGNSIFSGVHLRPDIPRVLYTDYVPQEHLPALYCGAAAFVYPALYEGFGLPPLEAMACGVPVAAANSTSIPEVTGDAALLFDPLSVSDIGEALVRTLTDARLREQMILKGLSRARTLTWKRSAECTWKVLEREAGS